MTTIARMISPAQQRALRETGPAPKRRPPKKLSLRGRLRQLGVEHIRIDYPDGNFVDMMVVATFLPSEMHDISQAVRGGARPSGGRLIVEGGK